MENQKTLAYFFKKEVQPSLGILGILRESFKITIRNGRITVFVTFIMFSYYAVVGLADHLLLAPVLQDMVTKSKLVPKDVKISKADPSIFKSIIKDVRYFLTYELVLLFFSCLVLTFSLAATVHSTYEAYTAKVLSLKDLFSGTRGRLKRPLITTLWMILIIIASATLLFIFIGLTGVMTGGSLLTALDCTVLVFGVFYYIYISAFWMLSLVVSVVEDNMSGMKALDKANELMKGKRLQGCVLMMLLMFASGTIYVTSFILAANQVKLVGLAIHISKFWSFCVLKLSLFVVFTMFYHECKKGQPVEENANLYAPISAIDQF
ncbi:hypothetical protein ACH5RR_003771 [Cinchona calisaya]|uniref:Uncharacterized protein n=1 Tax=Cinchona calisaya TaxID=153742 RepID=A0ABD3AVZ7_9GENT